MRCPTKMKIWEDICPVKEEQLFPALGTICLHKEPKRFKEL